MNLSSSLLVLQFIGVNGLLFAVHALRYRVGPIPFFVLIGGLTAMTSWITDAGAIVQVGGMTFLVGSAVFYTSILMGVFIAYVFEGTHAARALILTMIGVVVILLVVAFTLELQVTPTSPDGRPQIPALNLRTNASGMFSTFCAFTFLGIAWQFLHNRLGRRLLVFQVFITLLGVLWLDQILFYVLAFAGVAWEWDMFFGAAMTRLVTAVLGAPLLSLYMASQMGRSGLPQDKRPVFAILRELRSVSTELTLARQEITKRKKVEAEQRRLIQQLEEAAKQINQLRGLLPICSFCKKIRDDQGYWNQIEQYISEYSEATFSHGICPECLEEQYPDIANKSKKDKTSP